MNWRLIFIRHAHRHITNRSLDNGLSDKGRKQVKGLKKYIHARCQRDKDFAKNGMLWLSSPKVRCVETLAPLAKHFKARVTTESRLDEMASGESEEGFRLRLYELLKDVGSSGSFWVFFSSHGDCLPLMTEIVGGTALTMKKAAWMEYKMSGLRGEPFWSVPDPRVFLV